MTVVLEFSRLRNNQNFSARYGEEQPNGEVAPKSVHLDGLQQIDRLSEREVVTLLTLQAAVEADQMSSDQAAVFLLHTSALHFLPLRNRRLPKLNVVDRDQDVMMRFTQSAATLLRNSSIRDQLDSKQLPCDLADLLDGFLLTTITHGGEVSRGLLANEILTTKFESLCAILSDLCGEHVALKSDGPRSKAVDIDMPDSPVSIEHAVLPFKNSVFDKHLEPVHLQIDDDPTPKTTMGQTKIFREISHWHNRQKAIVQKGPPQRSGWYARRRNQWFMAEMLAYAASLTNAAGKGLEPETIIPGQSSQVSKQTKPAQSINAVDAQQNAKEKVAKASKKPGNATKKGGKAAALEAAAAIKAEKSQSKADTASTFWKTKCKEIQSQIDHQIQYTLAKKFLQGLSTEDAIVLGAEVELFMIDCLLRIWTESRKSKDGESGIDIAALIWDAYLRLSKTEVGMTPTIVANLEAVSKMLGFPTIQFKPSAPDRPLAFTVAIVKPPKQKSALNTNRDMSIPGSQTDFQLEHCGPFFDRAIDSAPDHRVPFQPDGWQRKVLDAIDVGKSLFVVAPTSAGKTFISFYAMKKVLEANDDDVIVYVAPTKALVNQIAAEIQARFSKTFKHAGRSVWGIHTRDYRINNPTGCQVLVTVPHILQIMLLSPSHAEKKGSWSYRIKRIIFDEVHCIGQADDGLIWEQLLLQAPCPIIALSATVGNPQEFSDWLGSTQRANGHDLVTVQHEHRYSDLRKFVYLPPKTFCFSGLPDLELIHTPGLDGTDAFAFVHPVSSLVNRSRGMPNDLSLEARDCLRLWQCMAKHQTENHPLPSKLNPDRALPSVIKKADILKWEAELKGVLRAWMTENKSPFENVRRDLAAGLTELSSNRKILATKHECDTTWQCRSVHGESLKSTILPALVELHSKDALPAIVFNYDRSMCEQLAKIVIKELERKEHAWKQGSAVWKKKVAEFEKWTEEQENVKGRAKAPKKVVKKKDKRGDDEDDDRNEDEKTSKAERSREAGSVESSKWAGFNPTAPVDGYHFVDVKKLAPSELLDYQRQLRDRDVDEWLVHALGRGTYLQDRPSWCGEGSSLLPISALWRYLMTTFVAYAR